MRAMAAKNRKVGYWPFPTAGRQPKQRIVLEQIPRQRRVKRRACETLGPLRTAASTRRSRARSEHNGHGTGTSSTVPTRVGKVPMRVPSLGSGRQPSGWIPAALRFRRDRRTYPSALGDGWETYIVVWDVRDPAQADDPRFWWGAAKVERLTRLVPTDGSVRLATVGSPKRRASR